MQLLIEALCCGAFTNYLASFTHDRICTCNLRRVEDVRTENLKNRCARTSVLRCCSFLFSSAVNNIGRSKMLRSFVQYWLGLDFLTHKMRGEDGEESDSPLPEEEDEYNIWREEALKVLMESDVLIVNTFAKDMYKMWREDSEESDNPLLEEEEDDDDDDSEELDNPLSKEEDEDDADSSNIGFSGEMAWLCDDFNKIKNQVLKPMRPSEFAVFSIVGVIGSGRTIHARYILEQFHILINRRSCSAWVTIGPKYQLKEILLCILDQVDSRAKHDHELLISEGDEKLGEYLYSCLKGRTYIIVLDDVRDTQIWDHLRRSFPEENDDGSLVLLTTGTKEVALSANSLYIYEMANFTEDAVGEYFRIETFGRESFPPEVEEAWKKIFKNSKGINLVGLKVLLFLCKAWKTPEKWIKLAADTENPIFMVVDEISEMSKIKKDLQFYRSFLDDDDGRTAIIKIAEEFASLRGVTTAMNMQIFPKKVFPTLETVLFYGMAGIGKTIFVKKIFEDPSIVCHFDHRAWVTLGQKYQSKEILADILAQIYPDIDKRKIKRDAKLAKDLCTQLSHKRCLIVLDDAWNIDALAHLSKILPDIKCKALVTSRQARKKDFDMVHEMRLLNKEESWYLLRQKVFDEGLCPFELENVGRKIAENCDGLPLTIVKIAKLLSKVEKTQEYWNKVVEKKNSCFNDVYKEISETLYPSYESLTPDLKNCFLYMGVFRQNFEILTSKLINLWIAEGFFEGKSDLYFDRTAEDIAARCLSNLVERSIVMICQKGFSSEVEIVRGGRFVVVKGFSSKVKTCRLHSIYWHLANIEAAKDRFFHAFNICADNSIEDINSQARLCIRNSTLLGIKDVQNTIASISSACSLLCTGPPHQYPVPICFNLRLLKVMDALAIRLYEFPTEVVKLIRLRYLALTCNGNLPASISKLWKLQFLIVSRHLSINSSRDSTYLPMEIWDMKELKHLQIKGSNLPNPNSYTILENLSTLIDVNAQSCTEEVLKGIPNLKKLGIQIELVPDDDGKFFHCLNHICYLSRLVSLKCVIVNPELKSKIVAPPAPVSMFPSGLKKLSLSGLGYPWKYMSIIAKLPSLEVLKLRCYAFQGPEWEVNYGDFFELRYLLIEDTDLMRWKFKLGTFIKLECLRIKHCYKLDELSCVMLPLIEVIEVVDCNSLAMAWAEQMEKKNLKGRFTTKNLKVQVHSSWNAKNLRQ